MYQKRPDWPELPYNKWKDTLDSLHMELEIAGKVKLALSPFLNQWWEVAFELIPSGLSSGRIPFKDGVFAVDFNFLRQVLEIKTDNGEIKTLELKSRPVAEFYKEFFLALKLLNITPSITPIPVEFTGPIPFAKDFTHKDYDSAEIKKWHQIQLKSASIFDRFRSSFRGKSSPVQFFWGSFDLNGTRFSGKKLPEKTDWPKGYKFMQFAENEENFAFGFWPGDAKFPYPAYYAYVYPAPPGYETVKTGPAISYFNKNLAECILPYEEARKTDNPELTILNFLETTYLESVKLAGWDYKTLEGITPE